MPNKISIQVQIHDAVPRKSEKSFGLRLMEFRARVLNAVNGGGHRGALDRPSLREVRPPATKRVRD